jgi:NAD(P) transhydrogenase subunit beta
MNRSFISVILASAAVAGPLAARSSVGQLGSAEDAAYILKNSSKVIIVPGYGWRWQAQHAAAKWPTT